MIIFLNPKLNKMKNKILLGMIFLIILYSCTESKINTDSEIATTSITLKTSNKNDVKNVLRDRSLRKNNDSLFKAYPQFMKEIPLQGTNAKITSVPVQLKDKNTYSRMFSLNINGEQQNVIYNMIPDSTSTTTAFTGNVLVTDMEGYMKSFIKVKNNDFEKITLLDPIHNINDVDYTTYAECENGCPFNPCDFCELEEVVIIADPTPDVIFIFISRMNVPEITPADSEEDEQDPEAPASGGTADGDDVNDPCPPGMIEDANGICIDTCDDDFIMNDDYECVEVCPPGYVRDIGGNCKKKPCEGDPIKNPTVAAQTNSGLDGGRYGCTRNGAGCDGQPNKKKHGGLDVLNPHGAPVFAMYDGVAAKSPYELDKAGWVVVLTANIDGVSTKIQYFHLQESNRTTGSVSAGDIIGYQGVSGNLDEAIADGKVESHTHIKIENNQGLQDPEDYIGISTTEDGSITIADPDCN